jgi:hypothetical protein
MNGLNDIERERTKSVLLPVSHFDLDVVPSQGTITTQVDSPGSFRETLVWSLWLPELSTGFECGSTKERTGNKGTK